MIMLFEYWRRANGCGYTNKKKVRGIVAVQAISISALEVPDLCDSIVYTGLREDTVGFMCRRALYITDGTRWSAS